MTCTLWFDVEDLFRYAETESRPSGIQRLVYELYSALKAHETVGARVRFLRHHPDQPLFVEADWAELEGLYRRLSRSRERGHVVGAAAAVAATGTEEPSRRGLRAMLGRWASPGLKVALGRFLEKALAAARLFPPVLKALADNFTWRPAAAGAAAETEAASAEVPSAADAAGAPFARGDVLLCMGSPWFNGGYAALVRRTRARCGVRFAVMVHDLIPVRRPEWCAPVLTRRFRDWIEGVLPVSDVIFANSRATAGDVERYAAERGVSIPPVKVIPIGSGFTDLRPAADRLAVRSPVGGDYALVVSTIEARKNHVLLFRVWRRLLEEKPAGEVPTLVFAGRVGWLVADLMQQLENAAYLDGKIVLVENPSDAELEALYRGGLFTLFPSLYEGWGLPVTESLMFGKPCLASNRTSLPEAGGDLCRYFDPENLEDAFAAVRRAIEDRAGLAAWEAEVKAKFRPTPWSAAAEAVLEALAPA